MTTVRIGDRLVGDGQPCLCVAEIGINANGSVDLAKQLITVAADAGCDAVKFQKRTVDVVYTPEELAKPRDSVFGTTNGDLKRGLEFGECEYRQIADHCASEGIMWTASPWDVASVDFLERFGVPFYKIASASLTDTALLRRIVDIWWRPVVLSTGMSSPDEIHQAVNTLGAGRLVLLHCTSSYPTPPDETNLLAMSGLRAKYPFPIGFSSHEQGTAITLAAVALGACVIERHITLDRTLWGSDQSVSLEPDELCDLVLSIRTIEAAMGDGIKTVYGSEIPIREKLRRV